MPRRPALPALSVLRILSALLVAVAPAAGAQLTIRLPALPPGTPAGATVYVAGTFNGWRPGASGWALAPTPGGGLALTLPDSVRGPVAFKLTLGRWERVEVGPGGADVPNRTVVVPAAGARTVTAAVAGWRTGPGPARGSTRSPNVRVLADAFPAPALGGPRRVWVYLPPGYARSTARYPVLYVQDGQNVFDAATSFSGEWGADEALDSIAAAGGPAAIVVAVDHGGAARVAEYTPWRSADPRLAGSGRGNAYVRFLAGTLKPYVDAHFRTRPGPADTRVLGSSLGGLVSLYAALRYPATFGGAGVFSPSVWTARDSTVALARGAGRAARRAGVPAPRVYLVSGTDEGTAGSVGRDQGRVAAALRAGGTTRVAARVVPGGRHEEAFWRREFPAAYVWLFAR